jgi:hypothetical protein
LDCSCNGRCSALPQLAAFFANQPHQPTILTPPSPLSQNTKPTTTITKQDVKVAPGDPYLFWSASEDGTVRQFDTRLPNQKSAASPNVLLRVTADSSGDAAAGISNGGGGGPGRRVELKGLDICPTAPHLMAVACGDPFVRLFDRRMLAPGTPAQVAGGGELLKLAPPHLPIGGWPGWGGYSGEQGLRMPLP